MYSKNVSGKVYPKVPYQQNKKNSAYLIKITTRACQARSRNKLQLETLGKIRFVEFMADNIFFAFHLFIFFSVLFSFVSG